MGTRTIPLMTARKNLPLITQITRIFADESFGMAAFSRRPDCRVAVLRLYVGVRGVSSVSFGVLGGVQDGSLDVAATT